ncbi:helix-turn-helix domain-containing protein [Desulfococcaceae bacterium HSG9]|nr:helix-turn-helix domain-containing protein [Desulfococcaceae bacterium HSG9]
MRKKYIVRLDEEERRHLNKTIKKLKGGSQKVRRAHILLKADADGSNWTDKQIAEAFCCRTQTVENIRKQFVANGFRQALDGKKESVHRLRNY